MNIEKREGFRFGFNPSRCDRCKGSCCTGKSGYIWINEEDITNIAGFLGKERDIFIDQYVNKLEHRYSLKEIKQGRKNFECILFDRERMQCSIYPLRPKQCRTFPFWEQFKDNFENLRYECPGVILL